MRGAAERGDWRGDRGDPRAPGKPGLRSWRGRRDAGCAPPLTFQDEGVDVPVDAQEVALPPEARVGGEQRPATLGVQPSEPQQRAPGLRVCAPGAAGEQSSSQGRRVPQRQVRQGHQAVLLIRGVGARAAALAALLVAPGVGLVPVIGEDGRDEQPQGAKAEAEAERRDERPRLHGFPARRSRRWARRRRQTQCTWPRRSAARPPSSPPPAPHSPPTAARPPARLTPRGSLLPPGPAPSPLAGSPHSTVPPPRRFRPSSLSLLPAPAVCPPSPFLHLCSRSSLSSLPSFLLLFPGPYFSPYFSSTLPDALSSLPLPLCVPGSFCLYIPALDSKPPRTYPCADRLRSSVPPTTLRDIHQHQARSCLLSKLIWITVSILLPGANPIQFLERGRFFDSLES